MGNHVGLQIPLPSKKCCLCWQKKTELILLVQKGGVGVLVCPNYVSVCLSFPLTEVSNYPRIK